MRSCSSTPSTRSRASTTQSPPPDSTGVRLAGVRLDSGDLLALSRSARRLLDEAGMADAVIVASGDLDEREIVRLVAAGAPVAVWGVGRNWGPSRDSPAVGGVYKLVADRSDGTSWRGVAKRSPAKATLPGPKQVFRRLHDGVMMGDVVAIADEALEGRALLTPAMRNGRSLLRESLSDLRARAAAGLAELPAPLRRVEETPPPQPYPVTVSPALLELAERGGGRAAACEFARGLAQHGRT